MKKVFILTTLLLAAVPAFSQTSTSQIGFLLGGSRRLYSNSDKKDRTDLTGKDDLSANQWRLTSVKEIWWATEMEPGTWFRIRGGEIDTPVGPVVNRTTSPNSLPPQRGRIQHVDALIDYKFSEPFGSTGLFAGIGFYRDQEKGGASQSAYGFTGGVNGDFPITRRYGVIVEGTYHWVNFDYKPRVVTVTAGLRVSF